MLYMGDIPKIHPVYHIFVTLFQRHHNYSIRLYMHATLLQVTRKDTLRKAQLLMDLNL